MRLLFVTPAFRRFELSRICFEQRQRAIEKLAASGIEAQSVVVSDDENLDIARSLGHATVERDNEWLGRRFNDGYQYAHEHDYDYAFPIGSDSWVDPQFIIDAWAAHEEGLRLLGGDAICSRHYVRFNAAGTVRRQIWVPMLQGVSYVLPVAALAACGYRPCQEEIPRGCDGSTWQVFTRAIPAARAVWWEHHEFETVAFESSWPQVTKFEKLGGDLSKGDTTGDIWSDLRPYYGDRLVDQIVDLYGRRGVEACG